MSDRATASKAMRQAKIRELIGRRFVRSQTELADLLAMEGIVASQGTLSKDLLELGVVRVRGAEGVLGYGVPTSPVEIGLAEQPASDARLARLCNEVLLSAVAAGNLLVLRTPPGAAQYFASAIDRAGWGTILGTIAGDDTVMVIARDSCAGDALVQTFVTMSATGKPVAEKGQQ